MIHEETCLCTKKKLRFQSVFGEDVVTQLYCPKCIDRASEDAIIFEMCEPSLYVGYWGVRFNDAILKEQDPAFRHTGDYYLSLLMSGRAAPEMVARYGEGGLCRILGFKHGPDEHEHESSLSGEAQTLHDQGKATSWPGDVNAGPKERRRGRTGST